MTYLSVREGYLPSGHARLFFRDIGEGLPIFVLHGGPDFDHNYLLPEMDLLADSFCLIYYDQRGRGRSAEGARPEEVDIASEIEDLESLQRYFQLDSFALLGHSWGGVIAMEYAIRYPDRVSHLMLMNTAPASHQDLLLFREHLRQTGPPGDVERMEWLRSTDRYQRGDLDTEAEYYRIHFRVAVRRAEQLEEVVGRLRSNFTEDGVLKARAIQDRLYEQTWSSVDYDLVPALSRLDIPTLILHGDSDFVPVAVAARIAEAMPRGQLAVLPDCGHFAYLEAPEPVHMLITSLLTRNQAL